MNPFFALRRFFRPPKPSKTSEEFEIPLGLTPEEFSSLKDLMTSPAWEIYLKALDETLRFNAEALLAASEDENLHFHRGVIHGIRKAARLVHDLKQAEQIYLNERRNEKLRRSRAGDRSSLFGSPFWDSRDEPRSRAQSA